jgi:hypothetical protein
MTEATANEFYSSRVYEIEDLIIYNYKSVEQTSISNKVNLKLVLDLGQMIHVTVSITTFDDVDTDAAGAEWYIIKAGTYDQILETWTGLIPAIPAPFRPVVAVNASFLGFNNTDPYGYTATLGTDGVIRIARLDEVVALTLIYHPHGPVTASTDISLPVFTFTYPSA